MIIYVSELNENIEVDDKYLPRDVGVLDEEDFYILASSEDLEEDKEEVWEEW